ncbi:sigma-70 family RNA polymerase sigma factor [Streptomyces sp. NPDC001177]
MDSETFISAVYEQHGKLLLRFAARMLGGDWHRAEDVLQEAAIRAWRHAGVLGSSPVGLRPWLFTVVRNLAIDDYRARTLRPVEADGLNDTDVAVPDDVDRLLTQWVVSEALQDLTDQHREVLAHMYFNGSSVALASELLGIPPGTVKSRTHNAMRALGKALTARGLTADH